MQILELLAVIAIILTALAVMTGSLEPGDALRRLGTTLILMLIMPAVVTTVIRCAVLPLIAPVVTVLGDAAFILAIVSVTALVICIALGRIAARQGNGNHGKE